MPTVLIADDSPVALHLLGKSLRASGLTVIETTCAHDASVIDPFTIDAALLDLDLGDGDGATVAETLRAKRADLPVAFFSSETKGPIFSRATALATVYSKENADAAVAWAIEVTRPA
ncbi:MAG: response regulator [Polyangiaceae bacterium]